MSGTDKIPGVYQICQNPGRVRGLVEQINLEWLNEWERDFLSSVGQRLVRPRRLSVKQARVLQEILQKQRTLARLSPAPPDD